MSKVSMIKAMILKRRLSQFLDSLNSEISYMKTYILEGDTENNNTLAQKIEMLEIATDTMSKLNTDIDTAKNTKTQGTTICSVVNSLEIYKRTLETLKAVYNNTLEFKPTIITWDEHEFNKETNTLGKKISNNYKLTIEPNDIKSKIKLLTKKIDSLEELLAELNTIVCLPTDSNIYEAIFETLQI